MASYQEATQAAIKANEDVANKLKRGEKLTAEDYAGVLNRNYAMAAIGLQEENALVLMLAVDLVADTIIELRRDGYIETFDESTQTYTVEATNG